MNASMDIIFGKCLIIYHATGNMCETKTLAIFTAPLLSWLMNDCRPQMHKFQILAILQSFSHAKLVLHL